VPVDKNGITGSKSSLPAAPRSAPRLMRIAAIVGPVCGALCIVLGVLNVVQGHGVVILILGCVLSVFWIFMIPGARREGKL
jgi:hypothetical protein